MTVHSPFPPRWNGWKWPHKLGWLLWRAADNGVEHDGIEHAGYLAFLSLLALFPFLVFIVALTGFVGASDTGAHFVNFLFDNLPPHLADALRPRVHEIISGPPQGLLTLAILGAIWTSSSAVEGYRTVLNRAFHVANVPSYWTRRATSILQLLMFAFLLVIGMIILVVVPVALERLPLLAHGGLKQLLEILGGHGVRALTVLLITAMAANLYYVLPNTRLMWRDVAPGALVTGLGWMMAADLFSTYLSGVNRINLIYGSLGGIIAVLIFFYVANLIFIFGAEFNHLLAQWRALHRRAVPPEDQ